MILYSSRYLQSVVSIRSYYNKTLENKNQKEMPDRVVSRTDCVVLYVLGEESATSDLTSSSRAWKLNYKQPNFDLSTHRNIIPHLPPALLYSREGL